ncbi:MAG: phospholipid/cholesterol/gamma-HCH transport system substrate-binding protein [Cryomorphaceae bacterium]|jgi:phospholipid/cholesterol/gamma-HCH transport system substrate-binding protein
MAIKEKRSEAIVGLFLLLGLAVLGALIVKFGRIGENNMEGRYNVEITFNDASGLIKGSEIRMGGARIGKITNTPELQDDLRVLVQMRLTGKIKIDKESSFQIQSLSILGDKMIVVTPPDLNSGEFLADGDVLLGSSAGGLEALQSDAESVARDARVLMKDARTTLLKVDSSLDDIRAVAGGLAESIDKINTDVLDKKSIRSLKNSIANLEQVTSSFKEIGDEVKPTFNDVREAIASVKSAADAATKTFEGASAQLKNLEPALASIPVAVNSFKSAATKAEGVMGEAEKTISKINASDGLLSTLTDDKEFSTDTKKFVKNLKHYGILRYKDDETYDEKDPKENRFRGKRR